MRFSMYGKILENVVELMEVSLISGIYRTWEVLL